ncbi:MAG: phosphoribosylamine--glycine ligase, partial [Phycisphaerae bacterium]
MNVLVIGGGGREHALVDRLAACPSVEQVICAPGNAGTAGLAENVDIGVDDQAALADLALERRVDLTVVGPEGPLCAGIVDRFESAGLRIFGPTARAARIEGDKAYAKTLMSRCMIPTAKSRTFSDYEGAKAYVASRDSAQVVKAAGLASGKGVVVCDEPAQAILALEDMMVQGRFGQAGQQVVVEEKLAGTELSIFALVDGRTLYVLESAQDYKRIGDGDVGANTGGMGALSPSPRATAEVYGQVQRDILVPIVDSLRSDGAAYRGLLYVGLMLTAGGPKVLEFNCRFGDPETQAVLMRLEGDLAEALRATVDGQLDRIELGWDPRPAVCVVMTSAGYPGAYEKGKVIHGLVEAAAIPDVKVFQAGTAQLEDLTVTNGGRVLGVTALGDTVSAAAAAAYRAVECIRFDGAHYRKDIAASV